MALTREQADKILSKNLANVLAKLNAGKTLTAAERATIEAQTAGGSEDKQGSSAFAANWDQLAERLGISRRGLTKVRSRFKDQTPEPKADGRHDVAAWSRFFVERNINGAAIDAEPPGPGDEIEIQTESYWRRVEAREKAIKLQIHNAKEKRELIPLEELQDRLPAMLMAFKVALDNAAPRLAQKLEGVEEFDEILEILEAEIEVLKKTFADCPFLEERPVEIEGSADTPVRSGQEADKSVRAPLENQRRGKPPANPSEPFDRNKLSREKKTKARPASTRKDERPAVVPPKRKPGAPLKKV